MAPETGHIEVWEFQVKPECVAEFAAAYGPSGDWAHLFSRSPEFAGVELVGSSEGHARFFTLDRWGSAGAMDEFLTLHATAYDVLDRRFRNLTVWERRIGGFPAAA